MAHKKAGGSTRNGRDSHSKRLGVKKFGGESVLAGNILVRQRGTTMRAGANVGIGTDHTLFALRNGKRQVLEEGRGRTHLRERRLREGQLKLKLEPPIHSMYEKPGSWPGFSFKSVA